MMRRIPKELLLIAALTASEGLSPKDIPAEEMKPVATQPMVTESPKTKVEDLAGYINLAHKRGLATETMAALMNLIGLLGGHKLEFTKELYEELIIEALEKNYENTADAFGHKYAPEALQTVPTKVDTAGKLQPLRDLAKGATPMPRDTTDVRAGKAAKVIMPPLKFGSRKH